MTIQHNAIADPDIHEPKGIATAAVGKVYIASGAGTGTWAFVPQVLTIDIANLDTVADYYLVIPHAGTITKIWSVTDGAILTADKIITASIAGVAVTNGALTIAFTGAAAGDVDSATPTAANMVTAGQAIKLAATGASTGAIRGHISLVYTRTV